MKEYETSFEESVKTFSENLSELINNYGFNKSEMDDLKNVCNDLNAQIKNIMSKENLKEWETDEYKAAYVVRQNQDIDEDRMLFLLNAKDADKFRELGVIKTREYIDPEMLKLAMYNGYMDKELLAELKSCSTPKLVPTLTVKRKGRKKNERVH